MTTTDPARALVERSTKAQGLPLVIEDDATLERVAVILGGAVAPARERAA